MKTVTGKPCFQGDLLIMRIDAMPAGAKPVAAENGVHILAHSETGHHHVIESRSAQRFIDETNTFISYLDVAEPEVLEHMRSFDTHDPWRLLPGVYMVKNQRQATPEGWERAAD